MGWLVPKGQVTITCVSRYIDISYRIKRRKFISDQLEVESLDSTAIWWAERSLIFHREEGFWHKKSMIVGDEEEPWFWKTLHATSGPFQ